MCCDHGSAFHQLKVSAYRTDATEGTTPIWQRLPNLSAAKSAYGSIVYSKAPAVLRQAEFYLGADAFERAVQGFVHSHAYGAADWGDLVRALEGASPGSHWRRRPRSAATASGRCGRRCSLRATDHRARRR
jgi:aminopeptidase N